MRVALPIIALMVGCSSSSPSRDDHLTVKVAPLELDGVANVCYTLQVDNQQAETVWRKEHVCADRFGDGVGGLAYVGTCDASVAGLPSGDLVNDNRVTLVIEDLFAADGDDPADAIPADEYVNPCSVPGADGWDGFGPCQLVVPCEENADVAVAFDVTVMRRAHQGFFDVAVDFDDTFCSAKLDCSKTGLVHDPDSAGRIPGFVLGFACTSGSAADGTPQPTWLYLSAVTLTCDGLAPMVLDLAAVAGDGNQGPAGAGIVQWMQFTGDEPLDGGFDKCFWNIAAGLDMNTLAGRDCTLTATGSAASTQWPALTPPTGEVHPVITWSVPVLDGGTLCDNNALDAQGSGVRTGYVGQAVGASAATTQPFVRTRRCGADPSEVSCGGPTGATFLPTTVDVGGAGVPGLQIIVGGQTASFALPADDDYTLEGCCRVDCCATP